MRGRFRLGRSCNCVASVLGASRGDVAWWCARWLHRSEPVVVALGIVGHRRVCSIDFYGTDVWNVRGARYGGVAL